MYNLLLDVTASAIDWSRAQFALTAIYHWLFVPLLKLVIIVQGKRSGKMLLVFGNAFLVLTLPWVWQRELY